MSERRRRRSIFDIFDELFRELQEELEDFERELSKIHPVDPDEFSDIHRKPIVYGFRIEIGPDGVPRIHEFGNVRKGGRARIVVTDEREPLVDIYEEEDRVRIVAELPGVDENKIKVEALEGNRILIEASNHDKKYRKELELPVEVDIDTAEATYRNGVLEITIKKKQKEKKGRSIQIKKA
ncbi:MAG: archaeal heat shock protein Hsp20 [Ignisphaera sp.]|uniref:Hsp20/alpha crystallin family protein n=1 Tax=Ignisphaera aggregans TaxID=334771 RepID=A0A7J3MZY1_9CREN